MLCGCDFFKYPNISTYKAFKTIRQYDSFFLAQSPRKSTFIEAFYRAKFTFLNQLVYCSLAHKMVDEDTKTSLIGEMKGDLIAELG